MESGQDWGNVMSSVKTSKKPIAAAFWTCWRREIDF